MIVISILFVFIFQIINCGLLSDIDAPIQFFNIEINRKHPEKLYEEFENFIIKFNKKYTSLSEKQYRFNEFIRNHNAIGEFSKTARNQNSDTEFGVNKFADWSQKEYENSLSRIEPRNLSTLPRFNILQHSNTTRSKRMTPTFPKEFDLRKVKINGRHIIGPVKNQGSCGCCWAFAATGLIETAYSVHLGKSMSLSDQQVCDCGTTDIPGCSGGDVLRGIAYIYQNGQTDEDDYPYQDGRSSTLGQCRRIGNKLDALSFKYYTMDPYNVEYEIMKNLYVVNSPVAISFKIGNGFEFYKTGVLEFEDCNLMKKDIWHSALIVGYGSTKNEKGRRVDYWIVKNSWDSDWGQDGYIYVKRGTNWCHIESHPISADMRGDDYYAKN